MATLSGTRRNPNPRLGDVWTRRGPGARRHELTRWRVIENVGGDDALGGRVLLQALDGTARHWMLKEDLRNRGGWWLSARRCALGTGTPDGPDTKGAQR